MKTSTSQSSIDDNVLGINQLLCLPKAELKTKNSTERQLCCRLVEFLAFNSIYKIKTLVSLAGFTCTYDEIGPVLYTRLLGTKKRALTIFFDLTDHFLFFILWT